MSEPGTDHAKAISANRRAWDMSAPEHNKAADWQGLIARFGTPGRSTFDPTITAVLQAEDLAGKSVVQVGCNNGREVLSLAAFGAGRCLGIDQSAAFLDQAETLRVAVGSDAGFLCANIYALPEEVPRDFDVALITIGVLNWMPDLPRFFEVVAGLIRPGGQLIIYETHPFLEMLDPDGADPMQLVFSYFVEDPVIEEESITYDGPTGGETAPTYWFIHRIGEILNAVIGAGFTLRRFDEHSHSNREVAYDIYEGRQAQPPMCYTLVAERG